MPNKMLIDASHPEETRVVVTRGNRIEEFDFESQDKKQLKGNIYLARVTRVEPSLQAAFVEYGGNRHGFLAFSEIHPDYYQIPVADRQALLRAEAEANEDEDDEEDGEGEGRHDRNRGRRRRRGGRSRDREALASDSSTDGANADSDEGTRSPQEGEIADLIETFPDTSGDADSDETRASGALTENAASAETPAAAGDPQPDDDAPDESKPDRGSIAAAIEGEVISEPVPTEPTTAIEVAPDANEDRGTVEEVAPPVEIEIESVGAEDALEEIRERRRPMRRHYKIQEVIKRRQILLVQVVKEERGNKGAALTTYLSLAGRYSVLMPNTARGGGISRKITNAVDRKRLKDVVRDLDVPDGMGVILRTAGENRTKAEIKRDYEYLMRLWENVRGLTLQSTAPALVYEEGSLIKRSVRDLYNKEIDEILVAGDEGYREAKDFMRMLMPSHAKVVQPYRDSVHIYARNGIEAQLDRMLQPQVTLKSGGYIIINQTEALVSIDVNSGRSTREHSIEDTALQTNLEAAEEVARQLRLRDLAGLIVIDFIDMEENRNNRAVEKRMKDCLKNDRARIQVGRISHFGLLEMSRQRIRASVLESTMKPCPHCGGTGHVRSDSSVALHVVRAIEEFLQKDARCHITVKTPTVTALYVLNHKRLNLTDLEARFAVTITVEADETVGTQHYQIVRGAVAEKPAGFTPAVALPPPPEEPEEVEIEVEEDDLEDEKIEAAARQPANGDSDGGQRDRKKRRRRRRGGRDREQAGEARPQRAVDDSVAEESDEDGADTDRPADAEESDASRAERKKRRRGKRGGRRSRNDGDTSQPEAQVSSSDMTSAAVGEADADASVVTSDASDSVEPADAVAEDAQPAAAAPPPVQPADEIAPAAKTTRRRRSPAVPAVASEAPPAAIVDEPVAEPVAIEADAVGSERIAETESVEPSQPDEATPSRPSRRRASSDTAPSEPVVSSSTPAAEQPKKGGWWQRRSFF